MDHPQPVLAYHNPLDSPPPGSKVVREVHDDGVTFTILPEASASSIIALAMLGLLIAVILMVLGAGVSEVIRRPQRWPDLVLLMALTLPVLLALLPFIVATYRPMRHPTILSYRAGVLTLLHAASLRRRPRQWMREQIGAFRVPLRGLGVNFRTVADLKLHLEPRGQTVLLAGRNRAELDWIARCLAAAHEQFPSAPT